MLCKYVVLGKSWQSTGATVWVLFVTVWVLPLRTRKDVSLHELYIYFPSHIYGGPILSLWRIAQPAVYFCGLIY